MLAGHTRLAVSQNRMMEKMKMTRIAPVTKEQASATQIDLLNQIEKQLGMVPNFLKVLAQSPAALKAFL